MDRNNWTEKQKKIYDGLLSIGEEIAGFYQAGLDIYYKKNVLPNSAYLLLHTAREIDGGLRDILAADFTPEKEGKENHKKSILFSLGLKEFDGLAKKWHDISKIFSKYAHRRGAWKSPRLLKEVIPIWEKYEEILDRIIGSYYAIIERIEHISKINNLKKAVVETLCNILTVPTFHDFFFRNEKSVKWFIPLLKKGFLSPIRIKYDERNEATYWNVLDYLEQVSEQIDKNISYGKELIEIIDDIVQFSLKKNRINNHHIWWKCIKILNNIPFNIINENISVDKIRSWFEVFMEHCPGSNFLIQDIGEKMLPKFLENDAQINGKNEYAETLIDFLTEIKKGEKSSGLRNREVAVFRWNSYWIEKSLLKNSKLIGQKCSVSLILNLLKKLKNTIEFNCKEHTANLEIGNEVFRISVERIPIKNSDSDSIRFKDNEYRCVFSKFTKEQLQGKDKSAVYWDDEFKPSIELKKINFNSANKTDFIDAILNNLPDEILKTMRENLSRKISYVYDGLHSDHLDIWMKSLKGNAEIHNPEADVSLTAIIRDILLAKCESNKEGGREIIRKLISEEYPFPIFRRLALYCIDNYWEDYSDILEKMIVIFPDMFQQGEYEVELYDIFANHNTKFKKSLLKRLENIIENVPDEYVSENLASFWKFKWLSPLRDHPDFKILYDEVVKVIKPKNGKPYEPDRVTVKSGYVTHRSPWLKEEILQMTIGELVKHLKEFKGAASWMEASEGEPDKEGLASALENAVTENPNMFSNEIDLLSRIDVFYLERILRGFNSAWKNEKELEWGRIFSFFINYIEHEGGSHIRKAFQSQGEDGGDKKYIWIVTGIFDLIADGCREDSHAFSAEYFDRVEKLFQLLLPLIKSDQKPDIQNDSLSYALNTTLGRAIVAYITFALRVARVSKTKEKNWGVNKYERFLEKGIEGYIWFGAYLPQLKYLDKKYVEEKIISFSEKVATDSNWKAFMEGYLMGANVYRDIYLFMQQNYLKALGMNVFKEDVDRRMVEHICIGYLYGDELLQPQDADGKKSLFWYMLMKSGEIGKNDRWQKVIDFFWGKTGRTVKEGENDSNAAPLTKIKSKILEFWAWTFSEAKLVKSKLGDSYESFIGNLPTLTILFDKIDEEKEKWLLQSAPYIGKGHKTSFFIEYLTKFDDKESIERIGNIYLKVLEKSTPDYDSENIKVIVQRIYDEGSRSDANEICNTYGRRGIHFLRPIWEKNQEENAN